MSVAALVLRDWRSLGDRALWLVLCVALAVYGATLASPYGLRVLALAGCQVLMVLGYQFIFGHAGALSLAQGAFFGLGAYATAILGGRYGWGFLATFPLSILVPLAVAALVAVPVLRLATHYFALATLGLAQVALIAFVNGGELTGGALGLTGVPGISAFGWTVPRGLPLTATIWSVVTLGALLAWRLTHGLTGRAYAVLRSDPLAAAAIGLDGGRLRFSVFLLSAAYGGAAGALHAHTVGVVSSQVLEFSVMATCLAMTVIGGATRIAGAFLGALLLVYLPEWLRSLEGYALLAYGAALLAAIVAAPEGIAGLFATIRAALLPAPRPRLPHSLNIDAHRASPPMPLLAAHGLAKRFGGIEALRGVDLVIGPGEILGLIGPNGSGKTTLANLVSGFAAPDSGSVELMGQSLDRLTAAEVARAGIGRSFQTPVLPVGLTVLETVAVARASRAGRLGFAAAIAGRESDWAQRHVEAEALGLLRRVGADGEAQELCTSLKVSTAWRVEIARILALEPKLLVLDEPAAGLGESEQRDLASLLRELARSGLGIIVIEHNMPFLLEIADRVIVLDEGRVIAQGTPAAIRNDPAVIGVYLGLEGRTQ
jgi:branched-chain amino acid transport system permease protein